jgi:hypothetical protein
LTKHQEAKGKRGTFIQLRGRKEENGIKENFHIILRLSFSSAFGFLFHRNLTRINVKHFALGWQIFA